MATVDGLRRVRAASGARRRASQAMADNARPAPRRPPPARGDHRRPPRAARARADQARLAVRRARGRAPGPRARPRHGALAGEARSRSSASRSSAGSPTPTSRRWPSTSATRSANSRCSPRGCGTRASREDRLVPHPCQCSASKRERPAGSRWTHRAPAHVATSKGVCCSCFAGAIAQQRTAREPARLGHQRVDQEEPDRLVAVVATAVAGRLGQREAVAGLQRQRLTAVLEAVRERAAEDRRAECGGCARSAARSRRGGVLDVRPARPRRSRPR